jgi:hypothetical protein
MDEQIGQAVRQYTQQGPSSSKAILKKSQNKTKSSVYIAHAHLEAILYDCRLYSLCEQPG